MPRKKKTEEIQEKSEGKNASSSMPLMNLKDTVIIKPNILRGKETTQLSLTEQRILFYSIYKIQHDKDSISFTKKELEEEFATEFGSLRDIQRYLRHLVAYGAELVDESQEKLLYIPAFSQLSYDQGLFNFKFNHKFLPAVEGQKRFLQLGMQPIRNFKSKYSIYLYDYIKDTMWGDITVKKNISLADFKEIFKVSPTSYQGRNANFKARVWGPALEEVNAYSDYKLEILVNGRGNNTRFTILRIENEDFKKKNKIFHCPVAKNLLDWSCRDCYRINQCNLKVSDNTLQLRNMWPSYAEGRELDYYMYETFFVNPQYSTYERVRNNVANAYEQEFYKRCVNTFEENLAYEKKEVKYTEYELKDYVDGWKDTVIEIFKGYEEDERKAMQQVFGNQEE